MVENQQIIRELMFHTPWNLIQSLLDLLHRGWIEARPNQILTEGIDITTHGDAIHERSFYQGGPPPHEWIENDLSRTCEPLNKKSGQLRLETSSIGYLMKAIALTLKRSPKFIGMIKDLEGAIALEGALMKGAMGQRAKRFEMSNTMIELWKKICCSR
tara:strand:- start:100 stop:573 length:474 start_codon:yes stop_codon:yes gene_type:complete